MNNIFTGSQWSSSPSAYWTIQYEYRRDGKDMQYRFYWNVWIGSKSWYYDGLDLQLFIDGTQNDVRVKGYDVNEKGWNYEGTTDWYTVSDKITGTTSFYARLYDINAKVVEVTSSAGTLYVAPAYATSNQSLASKTETSITMNWSSDNIIDQISYQLDKKPWVYIDVADVTNGSYTVSNLGANSDYTIVTSVRRKDNGLWTNSSSLSVKTYDYPHCTSSPDFTIGDAVTLDFYNPLGRRMEVTLLGADGSTIITDATTGTSLTFGANLVTDRWYNSIPNSKSGKYKVEVVYGSITNTRDAGNTYSVRGTEIPSVCTLTYKDTDSKVVGITGNNQHIVQNHSNLQVAYTEATPNNGASSIAKYTFELNGVTKTSTSKGGTVDFGKVNSSSDLELKVTIEDSRGLTSSTSITIKMLEYALPIVNATLERLNNYEDETYLTVNPSISYVDGKNEATAKYKFKESGGSYGSEVAVQNGVKTTINCDKEKAFIFSITVTDKFGSATKEFALSKGKFPLFIDTELFAVGINEFPKDGDALRVTGGKAVFQDGGTLGNQIVGDILQFALNCENGLTPILTGGSSTNTPSFEFQYSSGWVHKRADGYVTISLNGFRQNSIAKNTYYNGAWTGWAILDEQADYVVEQGTSDGWTYRKWNSGIAECWGCFSLDLNADTQLGGDYYSSPVTVNYPEGLFVTAPITTPSGNGNWGVDQYTLYKNDKDSAQVRLLNLSSASSTWNVNLVALGRWK